MTLQRASFVTAAALLALAGGEGDAAAQETTLALTCVGTETGAPVEFTTRWGSDAAWERWIVQPGEWVPLTWTYDAPGHNTSPQLQLQINDNLTGGVHWVIADLDSAAASEEDCEGQGVTYDFHRAGDTLVLAEGGEPQAVPTSDTPPGFSVTFVPPAEEDDAVLIHELLLTDGTIAADVQMLNEMLELPVYVRILFDRFVGYSVYFPDQEVIVVDYGELLDEWKMFIATRPDASDEELTQLLVDDAEFALFHEVGHALVHLLELPVLGKQEDAVDSLATVIVLDIFEDPEAAVTGAEMWRLRAERGGPIEERQLAADHSLDAQRYATLRCLIYGSDPQGLAHIAEEDGFDERRTVMCPKNYEVALRSWEAVLEPHMR